MEMVERALRENPGIGNDVLRERATDIDASIAELSPRSFNARYPLQVKRKLAAEEDSDSEERPPSAEGAGESHRRQTIRSTLLEFAKAVAGAEGRGDVIDVLRDVDSYVDRALERSGAAG